MASYGRLSLILPDGLETTCPTATEAEGGRAQPGHRSSGGRVVVWVQSSLFAELQARNITYSLGELLSGSRDVSSRSLEVVELALAQLQQLRRLFFKCLKNFHNDLRRLSDKALSFHLCVSATPVSKVSFYCYDGQNKSRLS